MKIGVMSDTHDHVWNYEKAVNQLKKKKIGALIHCGDLCAPILAKKLVELSFPVHLVSGNTNDEYRTTRICAESENVTHHGEFAELELDGLKIAVIHFNVLAERLAQSGKYDVVFYGHTHKKDDRTIGTAKIINPGEILGIEGAPSFAVFDTETKKTEFFDLK
jgi:hypothetical protein